MRPSDCAVPSTWSAYGWAPYRVAKNSSNARAGALSRRFWIRPTSQSRSPPTSPGASFGSSASSAVNPSSSRQKRDSAEARISE